MTNKESFGFEEVWKSLEEQDKTGVYKRARETADLTIEQLEYAFNSGYEIAKAKYERSQGMWIPVSERLPEDMQRVLVWFEYYRYGDFNCMYQTYGFGYVCDGKWSPFINGETGWQDHRIIAWQPLPSPYEEGD